MEKEKKVSFLESHPRLNFLWGLALFMLFLYVGIVAIKWVGNIIIDALGKTLDKLSNLEAVIIVALITAAVSIVSVLFTSVISKYIDYRKNRQDYLAKKREEPYGEFVEMLYKVQQNSKNCGGYTNEQMIEDISSFSRKITLWGSSRVVKKWVKFRENGSNADAGLDNLLLMESIMNEMRKDLGLKKVKQGELLAFFVNDIKEVLGKMKK